MIAAAAYTHLAIERRGPVLRIELARPEALNAVNARLHTELSRVFLDAADDDESEVIVLTGAGRAFCAGGDVAWMRQAIADPESFRRTMREAKQIVNSLLDCEKPVIARVNGPAVGFGATLALFCDLIVASEDSYFSDPHVSIGMVAGDGGALIWPQLVGFARAKEYLMLGDRIAAPEAARMGLINRAVPSAQLDETVDRLAGRLAAGARHAIRGTKLAVNAALKQLAASVLDAGIAYEGLTNLSADHAEAVEAFAARRPPVFGARG